MKGIVIQRYGDSFFCCATGGRRRRLQVSAWRGKQAGSSLGIRKRINGLLLKGMKMTQKEGIYEKIAEYMKANAMLRPGMQVCVGCSGGADSLFLLQFLWEMRKQWDISVAACHVNHGMRAEASDGDAAFVQAFCEERNIPCYSFYYPVEELAAGWKTGTEEAGRRVRREAYGICVEKYGADCIALAHHQNDQAETVLFHLARGSALTGLAGISPVTEGEYRIIHPLLTVSRKEIERVLRETNILWRTDQTNLETAYSRNKIRHEVLPYLEQEINTAAAAHIAQAAVQARKADDFIRREAIRRMPQYVIAEEMTAGESAVAVQKGQTNLPEMNHGEEAMPDGHVTEKTMEKATVCGGLSKGQKRPGCGTEFCQKASSTAEEGQKLQRYSVSEDLLQEPEIIQEYILMEVLGNVAGGRKDLGQLQITQLRELFRMETGKRISLPFGMQAEKTYGRIRIGTGDLGTGDGPLSRPGAKDRPPSLSLSQPSSLVMRVLEEIPAEIPDKKYTKWLDYDKIKNGLTVRNRQAGDYLIIDDAGHRKKLKDYFIEQKIPREQRDRIPLLASGSRIFWIFGYRISADAKVTADTKRVIRIDVTVD